MCKHCGKRLGEHFCVVIQQAQAYYQFDREIWICPTAVFEMSNESEDV